MKRSEEAAGLLRLSVNGQERQVPGPVSLACLLELLELDPKRVAVERNEKLVRRDAFARTVLEDGDRLEIVTFLGGG